MFKIATLLKRRSGLTVDEFQRHLTATHGPLVAKCPGLRRYVQSLALPQGYRKGELLFDAITEMWFESKGAYGDFLCSSAWARADEDAAAFLDRSRTVVMPVDIHVVKDGPIPDAAVKNIEFVNRRPGMPLDSFRRYWRTVHGPLASRIPVICRYEQNHLAQCAYEAGGAPVYDGLAVTWFRSTSDMKAGTTTPEYAETRADEPHFLPDGHLPIIITREHVVVATT